MSQELSDLKTTRICIWLGPLLSVIFFIGFVVLMGYLPPPLASDSADTIARLFQANTTSMRLGAIAMMTAVAMIAPWSVTISTLLRDVEGRLPVLFNTQIVCIAVATLLACGFPIVWGLAAFRPDEISPEVTRMLNDFGFFFFLFPVPPFVIWFVAVAASIFRDRRDIPAFPRWAGYLSLWTAILSLPAWMFIFFKNGVFAFHGLIAFYIPLFIFFIWIVVMSWEALKTVSRHEAIAKR